MCAAASVWWSPVELRSGDVIDAPVEGISRAGVTVGGMQSRVIAWDRIARVTGARQREAEAFASFATDAWRARSRLARSDVDLARPIFERLYTSGEELVGPTGLLIAEGAMRCRLDTDPRSATEAWLDALVLRATGVKIDGEPVAEGFTDRVTGLAPSLPPVFLDGRPPSAPKIGTGDARADAYAAMYAFAMGAPITDLVRAASDDPAVEFVRLLVLAQRGEPAERDVARRLLEEQLRTGDERDWRDAWRLGAIGRALLRSEDEEQRRRAVFVLLEIPARWGRAQPHLSAVALHDIALGLEALGRSAEADLVRTELVRVFPSHPAAQQAAQTTPDQESP